METKETRELQQKIDMLTGRIEILEKKIEQLNSIEPLQMLVAQYRGNVWKLREKYQTLTEDEERNLYQRAYYTILREKGSWIGIQAKISNTPPHFPHGLLGIFISNGAQIGNNVVIFQHVTIGSNSLADSNFKGSPIIGDDVYIGAGAKIIGKVKIGNNCRIGANAVIARDIPDNSLVVLEKPRIIHKENMDNKFYQRANGKYGYYYNGNFIEVKTNS